MVHKMRAGLAALGIFIGTSTVIWLVAMGEGVSHQAQQQIKELGATNIIIRTKQPSSASDEQAANSRIKIYGLLRDDYRRIVENIPSIRRAIPMRELRFELRLGNRTADGKRRSFGSSVRPFMWSAVSRLSVRTDDDLAGPVAADCLHARTANRSLVGCFVIDHFPRRGDCIRSLSSSASCVHGPDRSTASRIAYTEFRHEKLSPFMQVLRLV